MAHVHKPRRFKLSGISHSQSGTQRSKQRTQRHWDSDLQECQRVVVDMTRSLLFRGGDSRRPLAASSSSYRPTRHPHSSRSPPCPPACWRKARARTMTDTASHIDEPSVTPALVDHQSHHPFAQAATLSLPLPRPPLPPPPSRPRHDSRSCRRRISLSSSHC